jgi:hypothetical protein
MGLYFTLLLFLEVKLLFIEIVFQEEIVSIVKIFKVLPFDIHAVVFPKLLVSLLAFRRLLRLRLFLFVIEILLSSGYILLSLFTLFTVFHFEGMPQHFTMRLGNHLLDLLPSVLFSEFD